MNNVLGSTIHGAMSFTTHACADEDGRRRQLLASSDTVVIETDAAVRDAAYGSGSSKDAIAESVRQTLADSAASGALTAAVADEAASLDPSSPLRFAAVAAATLAPTAAPTPAIPSHALVGWWNEFAIGVLVANLLSMIVFCLHMRRALTRRKLEPAAIAPAEDEHVATPTS